MEQTSKAPVLISVYDRKEHLVRCIDALLQNAEASETPLYIVSDGPQHEGHKEAIENVRNYIRTIQGFKEVRPIFRETNWGMRKTGMDAVEQIFAEHDRFIRMEDDIVCSPFYLKFMNEALSAYEDDDRIFCICANTHPKFNPPKNYPHDVFLWRSFCPWGYATWKGRWKKFLKSTTTELEQLKDPSRWKAYRRNRAVLATRNTYLQGKIQNDARINLHIFLTEQYAVHPIHTLCINTGMDGSGTHCGQGLTYPEQNLFNFNPSIPTSLMPSRQIHKKMYRIHFSLLNHGIGGILRYWGWFDPLYVIYNRAIGSISKRKRT